MLTAPSGGLRRRDRLAAPWLPSCWPRDRVRNAWVAIDAAIALAAQPPLSR